MRLERVSKIVWAILAPGDAALAQRNVICIPHVKTWIAVLLDARPCGVGRLSQTPPRYLVQRSSVTTTFSKSTLWIRLSGQPLIRAVLRTAGYILDFDFAVLPELRARCARERREGNRFAASPPGIGMITRGEGDISKGHIVDVTFVAQLDGTTPTAAPELAALENHVVNVPHRLGPSLHARIL